MESVRGLPHRCKNTLLHNKDERLAFCCGEHKIRYPVFREQFQSFPVASGDGLRTRHRSFSGRSCFNNKRAFASADIVVICSCGKQTVTATIYDTIFVVYFSADYLSLI
jgi:hypothetical protein